MVSATFNKKTPFLCRGAVSRPIVQDAAHAPAAGYIDTINRGNVAPFLVFSCFSQNIGLFFQNLAEDGGYWAYTVDWPK